VEEERAIGEVRERYKYPSCPNGQLSVEVPQLNCGTAAL
jgi:hypothetical protein